MASLKHLLRSPSIKLIMSSVVTNEASISTCVNSGWRSALRSSSLKHLAIWKYFSTPATWRSCLYCWGA